MVVGSSQGVLSLCCPILHVRKITIRLPKFQLTDSNLPPPSLCPHYAWIEASKIGWILGVEENLVLVGGFEGYNKPLLGCIRDEKLPIYHIMNHIYNIWIMINYGQVLQCVTF